jgi:hypothetical protein
MASAAATGASASMAGIYQSTRGVASASGP